MLYHMLVWACCVNDNCNIYDFIDIISGASEREPSCKRQGKISTFFFSNFSNPFSDSDGGAVWFSLAKNVSRSPSQVLLAMKRHENFYRGWKGHLKCFYLKHPAGHFKHPVGCLFEERLCNPISKHPAGRSK